MNTTTRTTLATLILAATLPFLVTDAVAQDAAWLESIQTTLNNESSRSSLTAEQWLHFGERITEALESDNQGVQRSALRLAAFHGDKLGMGRRAAISAVKVYRDDPNPNVRMLAVVAITRINHPWGIDFLTRSLDFEKEENVETTMRHALNEREMPPKK